MGEDEPVAVDDQGPAAGRAGERFVEPGLLDALPPSGVLQFGQAVSVIERSQQQNGPRLGRSASQAGEKRPMNLVAHRLRRCLLADVGGQFQQCERIASRQPEHIAGRRVC